MTEEIIKRGIKTKRSGSDPTQIYAEKGGK